MKREATNGKANGSKGPGDGMVCAFLANENGSVTLNSGKVIPKSKTGWKANDAAKDKAKAVFAKLKPAEQQEIRDFYREDIQEFLGKKAAFREFTAGSKQRSGLYR